MSVQLSFRDEFVCPGEAEFWRVSRDRTDGADARRHVQASADRSLFARFDHIVRVLEDAGRGAFRARSSTLTPDVPVQQAGLAGQAVASGAEGSGTGACAACRTRPRPDQSKQRAVP